MARFAVAQSTRIVNLLRILLYYFVAIALQSLYHLCEKFLSAVNKTHVGLANQLEPLQAGNSSIDTLVSIWGTWKNILQL